MSHLLDRANSYTLIVTVISLIPLMLYTKLKLVKLMPESSILWQIFNCEE